MFDFFRRHETLSCLHKIYGSIYTPNKWSVESIAPHEMGNFFLKDSFHDSSAIHIWSISISFFRGQSVVMEMPLIGIGHQWL